jgi:hypothetical protein
VKRKEKREKRKEKREKRKEKREKRERRLVREKCWVFDLCVYCAFELLEEIATKAYHLGHDMEATREANYCLLL